MHTIVLFYKYAQLENPEQITNWQRALCQKLGLKGRVIIAREGINATLEGTTENIEAYIAETKTLAQFADINFKTSEGKGDSFPKLSVRTRSEIVTLGRPNLFPKAGETGGDYLSAEELHAWFDEDRDDFVIFDMRNDYEFQAGRFEKSFVMPVEHFRDIPKTLEQDKEKLARLKSKKVVAVCTGGIRCEKGTAYLKEELGLENVYQLHDGIVTYMNKYPKGHFHGSLYVFDGRMTMRPEGMPNEIAGICLHCSSASEKYVNCSDNTCHKHFIICSQCLETSGGEAKILCKSH